MYRWVEPRMPAARPTDTKDELAALLIAALKKDVTERLEPLDAALTRVHDAHLSNELKQVMWETPAKGEKPLYTLAWNERKRLDMAKKEERTPPPAPWETGTKYRAPPSEMASRPKRQRGGGGGE